MRYARAAIFLVPALALLAAACGGTTAQRPPESGDRTDRTTPAEETTSAGGSTSAGPVEVDTTTVATGLETPWDLVFTPDGNALITERDSGRLSSVDPSGNAKELQRLPESGTGEGGLLGLALSPDYKNDCLVYAYYTTNEDNRVVRFRLGEEPQPILTGIPNNSYHDGGRIAFGPDGMLYVGTGDAGGSSRAQDLNSLGGKILRLEPDGSVPPDNPFPNSPVYSYGHRNVQGLAWDEGGQLYASEFGQNRYDEVNRIQAGGNYGWSEVEGAGDEPNYVDPITTFATSEASPSGATFLANGAIPQWEGDFFTASLKGQRLWRLAIDGSGNVTEKEPLLQNEYGRLRQVVQAPDGSLWVLTSNRDGRGNPTSEDDRILRLAPAGT